MLVCVQRACLSIRTISPISNIEFVWGFLSFMKSQHRRHFMNGFGQNSFSSPSPTFQGRVLASLSIFSYICMYVFSGGYIYDLCTTIIY